MLRFPQFRRALADWVERDPEATNLCDAYEDATRMAWRLRIQSEDSMLRHEYDALCIEIEQDILQRMDG